ncbi:MAG: LPS export ABC transporter periplasmic protein LptC [Legionella sp.]|nr:MAG: LPS export ABC transporter periplasmic protein LptC [Legionella sp.]
MNTAKQAIWLFFSLILLACSGWYFAKHENTLKLDSHTLSKTIDTTVSQLTVKQFNTDGVLANYLTTPIMHHIPKGDIHLLESPHILIAQEDKPYWEIHSKKAKSFGGGKKIIFMQEVVVHQNPGDKTQESTMKTEEVTYYPKKKKATTHLLVTYEQPGNFIQSTGMNAYLDEKRVELLHQARGSYAPAKG